MTTNAVCLKLDEECLVPALQAAGERLGSADGEIVLDFSSVRRIDSSAVRALERFADAADGKGVKVALHGVSVNVYKMFKLVKLTRRFSFSN